MWQKDLIPKGDLGTVRGAFWLELCLLGTKYLRTIFQVNVPWKDCAMLFRFKDYGVWWCVASQNEWPGMVSFLQKQLRSFLFRSWALEAADCLMYPEPPTVARWRMTSMRTSWGLCVTWTEDRLLAQGSSKREGIAWGLRSNMFLELARIESHTRVTNV